MRNRQSGITFLGLLVLIVVVGSWVYAGICITPLYLNYMKVAGTLEKVRDEFASNPGTSEFMIRKSIERLFDIEMVKSLHPAVLRRRVQGDPRPHRAAEGHQPRARHAEVPARV